MSEIRLGSLLLFLASVGCVGSVADPEHPGTSAGSSTSGAPGSQRPTGGGAPMATGGSAMIPVGTLGGVACQEAAPPVTAARRLTRDQYVNTVRDLIGVPSLMAGSDLPNDDVGDNVLARLLDPEVMGPPVRWLASSDSDGITDARVVATEFAEGIRPSAS